MELKVLVFNIDGSFEVFEVLISSFDEFILHDIDEEDCARSFITFVVFEEKMDEAGVNHIVV